MSVNDDLYANAKPNIFGVRRRPRHRRYWTGAAPVDPKTGKRYSVTSSWHWQRYAWACARRYWPVLDDRDRLVLTMRRAGARLDDVGAVLGVSKERVRFFESRALGRAAYEREREKRERKFLRLTPADRLAAYAETASMIANVMWAAAWTFEVVDDGDFFVGSVL